MPITFYCDACQGRMKVPNELGGKRGKCAHCPAIVTIPPPPTGFKGSDSGSAAAPIQLTESSERELANSLAPPADAIRGVTDPIELERERLALERARLEFDRARMEREREALEDRLSRLEEEAEDEREERRAAKKKARKRRQRQETRAWRDHYYGGGNRGGSNPVLAALCHLLLVGGGQIYAGDVGRGLLWLAGAVVAALIAAGGLGLWVAVAVWVLALVDAITLASKNGRYR